MRSGGAIFSRRMLVLCSTTSAVPATETASSSQPTRPVDWNSSHQDLLPSCAAASWANTEPVVKARTANTMAILRSVGIMGPRVRMERGSGESGVERRTGEKSREDREDYLG